MISHVYAIPSPDFPAPHRYPALVTYAGPPPQPLQFLPPYPPIQKKVRKVGAPLGVLILLGTIAGLIIIALTAFNPVGTAIGFVLSSIAMTVVLLAYLWLDRWEPEPPRLLILAFLWGASVAVIIASILQLIAEAAINPGATEGASPITIVLGAPLTEEAAKGLFLLLMMTGRRRNELNSLTDCLVYAGLVGAGFAWLEDILYIGGGETVGDSLVTAAMRLIMAPFAHSLFTTMFGIGVWYAMQNRNGLAKAGYILLGYIGAVIMHGLWNGSSLLGRRGVFRGVLPLDGADLRVDDLARGGQQAQGAADHRGEAARHGGGRPRDAQRGDLARFAQEPQGGDRRRRTGRAASPRRKDGQDLRPPGRRAGVRARPHRPRLRRRAGERAAERGDLRGLWQPALPRPRCRAWPDSGCSQQLSLVRSGVPAAAVAD